MKCDSTSLTPLNGFHRDFPLMSTPLLQSLSVRRQGRQAARERKVVCGRLRPTQRRCRVAICLPCRAARMRACLGCCILRQLARPIMSRPSVSVTTSPRSSVVTLCAGAMPSSRRRPQWFSVYQDSGTRLPASLCPALALSRLSCTQHDHCSSLLSLLSLIHI